MYRWWCYTEDKDFWIERIKQLSYIDPESIGWEEDPKIRKSGFITAKSLPGKSGFLQRDIAQEN